MLNCNKTQELISQYATGELVTPVREQVGDHLQQCTTCRQDLDIELEILTTLGNLPLVECPDEISENILNIIEQEEKQTKSSSKYWWMGASTLVAASLALVLILSQGNLTTTPENSITGESYTSLEIQSATTDARLALSKLASVINQNEKNAFEQVFGQEIPGAVGGSLLQITKTLQGDV